MIMFYCKHSKQPATSDLFYRNIVRNIIRKSTENNPKISVCLLLTRRKLIFREIIIIICPVAFDIIRKTCPTSNLSKVPTKDQ